MSLVTHEPIRMEYWWNGTDMGKLKCSEENLSECTFKRDLLHREYLQRVQGQITELFHLSSLNKYVHCGASGTKICVYVCMYVCVYVCMCVCFEYVCVCMYMYIYVCMHVCMYVCMCVCMYVYMF